MRRALGVALALAAAPAAATDFDRRFSVACVETNGCACRLLDVEVRSEHDGTGIAWPGGSRVKVVERADEEMGVHSLVSGVERAVVHGVEPGTTHALTVFGDGEARLTTHGLGRFAGAEAKGDPFARTDFDRCGRR